MALKISTKNPLKEAAKQFIDDNVWDGEDRSGCHGDCVHFTPDDLQELIDELIDELYQN